MQEWQDRRRAPTDPILVQTTCLGAVDRDARLPHRSGSIGHVRELSFSDVPGRRLERILHRSADRVRVAGVGLAGRACDAAAASVASVPEVWELLGVAAFGLAAADADEVESLLGRPRTSGPLRERRAARPTLRAQRLRHRASRDRTPQPRRRPPPANDAGDPTACAHPAHR